MVRDQKRQMFLFVILQGKVSVQVKNAGMGGHIHSFFNSALDEGDWSASHPGVCSPERRVLAYPFRITNLVC